jgi:GntR family galactonate operon transcriptional repressor
MSDEIGVGGLLPRETDLAAEFGISRQAVREVLKVLAAKGLVESRRRAGTHVMPRNDWNLLDPDILSWHPAAELDPSFFTDLVELRMLIEPAAAAEAATHRNAGDIDRIGAGLNAMSKAGDDIPALCAGDIEFHLGIYRASGNQLLERLSSIMAPLLEASFRIHHDLPLETIEATVELHRHVFQAIVAQDRVTAREAMETTLSAISEMTVDKLDRFAPGAG